MSTLRHGLLFVSGEEPSTTLVFAATAVDSLISRESPTAQLSLAADATEFHGADNYALDQLVARDEKSETKVFDISADPRSVFSESPSTTAIFVVTETDDLVLGGGQVFTENPSTTLVFDATAVETGQLVNEPTITFVLPPSLIDSQVTGLPIFNYGLKTTGEIIADIRSSASLDKTHVQKLRRGGVYRMLGGKNVVQYVDTATGDVRIKWHIPLANPRDYGRLYSASIGSFGDELFFHSPVWGDIQVTFDSQNALQARKHEPSLFGYEVDISFVRL